MAKKIKRLYSKIAWKQKTFNFWMGVASYAQKKAAMANMDIQVLTEQAQKTRDAMIDESCGKVSEMTVEVGSLQDSLLFLFREYYISFNGTYI